MKKKFLSVLLSTVMAASLLAGCGSSSTGTTTETTAAKAEAGETTAAKAAEAGGDLSQAAAGEDPQLEKKFKILSIWAEDNDNGILLTKICEDYKKINPNFDYEYELVSSDNLRQKVATLVASNDLPDMFVYEAGKPIVDLIEADKLVNLSEELNKLGVMGSMNESAVSTLKNLSDTEDLYDLPLGQNVEGFWYNKALFEKAGITEVPGTWDEFEADLEKLSAAGIQPLTTGGAEKWGATRLINAYIVRTMGADAMKKAADGEVSYTEAGYVAAAQKIQDWANKGYFGKGITTVDMNTAGSMLMNGDAAIFYNGSWFTANLNDESANAAGPDGIGFFNIPVVDEAVSPSTEYSMNCGNILCLSKDKYDEATSWFLKYFVENMGNLAMNEMGSLKGYTYDVEVGNMSGYTKMVLDEIGKAKSGCTWFEATMNSEVSSSAQDNVQTLLNGDMTAEEYMQSIQDATDASR